MDGGGSILEPAPVPAQSSASLCFPLPRLHAVCLSSSNALMHRCIRMGLDCKPQEKGRGRPKQPPTIASTTTASTSTTPAASLNNAVPPSCEVKDKPRQVHKGEREMKGGGRRRRSLHG